MIREFKKEDLAKLEPNKISSVDIGFIFDDDAWWCYTMEKNRIKAIICFREASPGEWAVLALISKHFTALDTLEMKRFLRIASRKLNPKKIWTVSDPAETIDKKHQKWLRVFGLVPDKPQEFQGKPYSTWATI